MSDWRHDLSILRSKKTLRGRQQSTLPGKENVGEDTVQRRSINVNDGSLAIVDPTLAAHSESTPKFKTKRSFGDEGDSAGSSSSEGANKYDGADFTRVGDISLSRPVLGSSAYTDEIIAKALTYPSSSSSATRPPPVPSLLLPRV